MSRKKEYDTFTVPFGVAKIAKAICADYDRRAAVLRRGNAPDAVLEQYATLNAAVDAALDEIDEPEIRRHILDNIIERRGYEKSYTTNVIICKNSYYARMRKVIWRIARDLTLV